MSKNPGQPTITKSPQEKEIKINNLTITYKDNGVKGDPIVFLHSSSLSSDTFENQFSAKEFQNHRLLAPDLPGHGKSKAPADPDLFYTIEGLTQTMVNWLDALKIKNAIMVGHALGGHLLLSAWPQIQDRCKALVIFGTPPFSKPSFLEHSHYDHPAYSLTYQAKLNNEQLNQLASIFVKKGSLKPRVILESIKKSDPAMRPILGASVSEPANLSDEAENLKHLTQPIAILLGRYDQMVKRTYFDRFEIPTLWRKKVQLIDNAGHCPQIENPTQFNQFLQQFLIDQLI